MKTTTLFVLGLALGAAIVFGVRATSLGDKDKAETADPPLAAVEHAEHAAPTPPEGPPAGNERPPENEICPVMGNPVDPEVYVDYKGRRIGFCCPGCDDAFLEDPETYLKKVDQELAAKAKAAAPDDSDAAADDERPPENEICPVMLNPVDPEVYVDYKGRRIGFCCPGCDDVFLEDPETYLKKVDQELAKKRGEK